MSTLEKLSNYLAALQPYAKAREGGMLIAEAKETIHRLEMEKATLQTENALFKSALTVIRDTTYDMSETARRIARDALNR